MQATLKNTVLTNPWVRAVAVSGVATLAIAGMAQGAVTLNANIDTTGTLTVDGNVTLGDGTGDTITMDGGEGSAIDVGLGVTVDGGEGALAGVTDTILTLTAGSLAPDAGEDGGGDVAVEAADDFLIEVTDAMDMDVATFDVAATSSLNLISSNGQVTLKSDNNSMTIDGGEGVSIQNDGTTQLTVNAGGIAVGGGTAISKHLSGTASISFASVLANTCNNASTITVTGAVSGDTVVLGLPTALMAANTNMTYLGYVSAADTVTVRRCNVSTSNEVEGPAAATVRADVWQH